MPLPIRSGAHSSHAVSSPSYCTSISHVLLADRVEDIDPRQTAPVTSLLNPIMFVSFSQSPEELVYAVTKTLLDTHNADLKAIHPGAAGLYAKNGLSLRRPLVSGARDGRRVPGSSSASNPFSIVIGAGGQPGMRRSTGITAATPPTTA